MRIEELVVGQLAAANDNVRLAEVALEGGANKVDLLAKIICIVGNAAVSSEFEKANPNF